MHYTTHLPNICYLTGYETSMADWYSCLVVPAAGELSLQVCDPALARRSGTIPQVRSVRWDKMRDAATELIRIIRESGGEAARIGLETARTGLYAATLPNSSRTCRAPASSMPAT
jgi:Xaa-Pro aminopeptidase